jgi:hypothetical protein
MLISFFMDILRSMLPEGELPHFLSRHFTRLPYSRPGHAQAYSDLLDWSMVEEVFKQKKSFLRIVKDAKMVKDYADVDLAAAKAYYASGHTIL